MYKPKIGDKVIVWKDGTLWVGVVTDYINSGFTWHSGHHPETWEMKIEDCDKGKSYDYWVGRTMTFKREEVTNRRMFCLYTEKKYEKVKAARKALYNAQWVLWDLLERDEEEHTIVRR